MVSFPVLGGMVIQYGHTLRDRIVTVWGGLQQTPVDGRPIPARLFFHRGRWSLTSFSEGHAWDSPTPPPPQGLGVNEGYSGQTSLGSCIWYRRLGLCVPPTISSNLVGPYISQAGQTFLRALWSRRTYWASSLQTTLARVFTHPSHLPYIPSQAPQGPLTFDSGKPPDCIHG